MNSSTSQKNIPVAGKRVPGYGPQLKSPITAAAAAAVKVTTVGTPRLRAAVFILRAAVSRSNDLMISPVAPYKNDKPCWCTSTRRVYPSPPRPPRQTRVRKPIDRGPAFMPIHVALALSRLVGHTFIFVRLLLLLLLLLLLVPGIIRIAAAFHGGTFRLGISCEVPASKHSQLKNHPDTYVGHPT